MASARMRLRTAAWRKRTFMQEIWPVPLGLIASSDSLPGELIEWFQKSFFWLPISLLDNRMVEVIMCAIHES